MGGVMNDHCVRVDEFLDQNVPRGGELTGLFYCRKHLFVCLTFRKSPAPASVLRLDGEGELVFPDC